MIPEILPVRPAWAANIATAVNVIVCPSEHGADWIRANFPFSEFAPTAVVVGNDPALRLSANKGAEIFYITPATDGEDLATWLGRPILCYQGDVQVMDAGEIVAALEASTTVLPRAASTNDVTGANPLPPIAWADDFMDEPLPDPVELIAGILHQGSKMVLGGSSKSFKTWTLLDMAISVASGSEWLGFSTTSTKVLYLNLEIQPPFMQKRIGWIKEAKGLEKIPNLAIWNLRGHGVDIARLAPEIITQALHCGFGLIIIDPIYKVGGDRVENAAEGVADLVNELEKIAVRTGAAVVFGAHYSKGNQAAKESIDRISGSGVFARDPDAILTFTAHEEAGAFTVEPTLRNLPPCEPFVLRWEWPLMHRDGGLDPTKLKKPRNGRESTYSEDDLLAPLKNGAEFTTTEWQIAVQGECGMAPRTFYSMKRTVVADKRVRKSGLSGKWTLA